jgi:hypothetical protein
MFSSTEHGPTAPKTTAPKTTAPKTQPLPKNPAASRTDAWVQRLSARAQRIRPIYGLYAWLCLGAYRGLTGNVSADRHPWVSQKFGHILGSATEGVVFYTALAPLAISDESVRFEACLRGETRPDVLNEKLYLYKVATPHDDTHPLSRHRHSATK